MTEIHPSIIAFREELEYIEIPELADFMKIVLEHAPKSFFDDTDLVVYTKKVFYVTKGIMEADNIRGTFRDMMYTAILISDLFLNEMSEDMASLHPVAISAFLDRLDHKLPGQMLEAILTVVEGHEGSKSPSKQLDPKPGQPAFMVALVHKILRQDFVSIYI